jgi:hypothetical protein
LIGGMRGKPFFVVRLIVLFWVEDSGSAVVPALWFPVRLCADFCDCFVIPLVSWCEVADPSSAPFRSAKGHVGTKELTYCWRCLVLWWIHPTYKELRFSGPIPEFPNQHGLGLLQISFLLLCT